MDSRARQDPESKKFQFWKKIFDFTTKFYNFLDLANFLGFLWNGKYPELFFRIAQISFNKVELQKLRFYDFTYVNRTVLWTEISSFLLFVLPMVKNLGEGLLGNALKTAYQSTTIVGTMQGGVEGNLDQSCRKCKADVCTMARVLSPCRHMFCYWCLEEESSGEEIVCPFCKTKVETVLTRV